MTALFADLGAERAFSAWDVPCVSVCEFPSPTPISDHSARDSADIHEAFAVPTFEKRFLLPLNDPNSSIFLHHGIGLLLKVTAILEC